MEKGRAGGGVAADMVNLQMGMAIGQQMLNQMGQNQNNASQNQMPQNRSGFTGNNVAGSSQASGAGPKFCPNCGTPTTGMKFCGNCGNQLF